MISKLAIRSKLIKSVAYATTLSNNYNCNNALFIAARQLHAAGCSNRNRQQFATGECMRQQVRSASDIVQSPLGTVKIPNTNVVDYCWGKSEKFVDKPIATCGISGRSYTFGMMRMLINRCAQALLGHCGMKPGEVVGLLLPNIPEYMIVCHGAFEAGLIVTFVNPLYTPALTKPNNGQINKPVLTASNVILNIDEIKRQFENAGVKMIITIQLLLEVATTVGAQLHGYRGSICVGGDDDPAQNVFGLQSMLMGGYEAELPGINPMETCLLPYSSGTTGLPKGVMLSHHNLVSNLVQGDIPPLMDQIDPEQQETVLSVLPFFHIYGFNGILNVAVMKGLHLITLPKFTPEDYIKALIEHRPTYLFVVPSLLLFLASHPAVTKDHLSSITNVTSGAAPATEGLISKFKEKVGRDDIVIRQGYGMTESSPVTIFMPMMTPRSKIGTVGVLYPNTEAKIISLSTGESLGTHKSGELLVRGPQVMSGYLNNEQATAETLDDEGWLHTGDVAYYDEDCYFYIVDRCKELIKVKGNQVSPTELENLILEIPGVADVAVVGIPDTLAGEVPKAFVVRKQGAQISEEEVAQYVNPKVTHYKKLAGGVKFIDAIPRNPNGKILRNELKIK